MKQISRIHVGFLASFSLFFPLSLPQTSAAFTGTEGAAFLELPIGARPAAMGQAYSALAEDAYAPVWNPAGLATLDDAQLAGMHVAYIESTSYEYGSYAQPLGEGRGLGLAIRYFRPGDIAGLDENANPTGDFGGYYADYALAFGQALGDSVSLGVTGHLIRAKIADVSADTYGFTTGILGRPSDRWRWAAVVANIGKDIRFIQQDDPLPLTYRLGGAFHPTPSWTLALEGSRLNHVYRLHTGVDYETPFGFSFRTGYNTERTKQLSPMAGVSIGVSMLIFKQDFSYTWLPLSDLGSSHLFSVVFHFGKKPHSPQDSESKKLQRPPPKEEDMFMEMP